MIKAFDHVAIPIQKVDEMIAFYQALGCGVGDDFGKRLYSIHFGDNKINFHTPEIWQSGKFSLRGPAAQPGCGDFCFVWGDTEVALHQLLDQLNANIEEGPVAAGTAAPVFIFATRTITYWSLLFIRISHLSAKPALFTPYV